MIKKTMTLMALSLMLAAPLAVHAGSISDSGASISDSAAFTIKLRPTPYGREYNASGSATVGGISLTENRFDVMTFTFLVVEIKVKMDNGSILQIAVTLEDGSMFAVGVATVRNKRATFRMTSSADDFPIHKVALIEVFHQRTLLLAGKR